MICPKSVSRAHCDHVQSDGLHYCCWCGRRREVRSQKSARLFKFPRLVIRESCDVKCGDVACNK